MINNKRNDKTIELNKSYNAHTRFIMNEQGNVEQQTILYEQSNGSQKQPVYSTKHCTVKVTRGGLIVSFYFDRRRMTAQSIESSVNSETSLVNGFITSDTGQRAIDEAEREILRAESNRSV